MRQRPHHIPEQEKRNLSGLLIPFQPASGFVWFVRWPQLLAKRPIHITPMADIVHRNLSGLAIDFIDDPIITHTQTIQSFSTLQLRRLRWIRMSRQAVNPVKNAKDNGTRNRLKIFLDGGLEAEAIRGHVSGAAFSCRQRLRAFQPAVQPPPRDRASLPSDENTA